MMLADAAQVANGKLFILGGGWSVTGPEPSPSAIVLKIAVPWDQANKSHHLLLSLIDDVLDLSTATRLRPPTRLASSSPSGSRPTSRPVDLPASHRAPHWMFPWP